MAECERFRKVFTSFLGTFPLVRKFLFFLTHMFKISGSVKRAETVYKKCIQLKILHHILYDVGFLLNEDIGFILFFYDR